MDADKNSGDMGEILKLCLAIDTMSFNAYKILSERAESETFKDFWSEMSKEEGFHVDFWKKLLEACKLGDLPDVFNDSQKVIRELRDICPKAQAILAECERLGSVSDALVLAYRLESHMLHPAFVSLFHACWHIVGDENPNAQYDSHISHFIWALEKYGGDRQELKLLGEALDHLWRQCRQMVIESSYDTLTGIMNRRAFIDAATRLACVAARQEARFGILMIDLDDLKVMNERYGHQGGDALLCRISKVLASSFRDSDLAGRYGGDEFIVFLFSPNENTETKIVDRLLKRMEEDSDARPPIRASIGFADGRVQGNPAAALKDIIGKADIALHEAKRLGKNRVVRYTSELDPKTPQH